MRQGLRSSWRPGASRRRAPSAAQAAVALALAVLLLLGGSHAARAEERVHDLSRLLLHGKRVKTRVSAATALDRMRDPRSLDPLVRALGDRSYLVRAAVATALGHLGDPAALPALERARLDPRRAVRRQVITAIELIRDKQRVLSARETRLAVPVGGGDAKRPPSTPLGTPAAPAQNQPISRRVYLMLKSASDKSIGSAAPRVREMRARRMRSLMVDQLERNRNVMLVPSSSRDPAIDPYTVDLTVVKLDEVERGHHIEVACEIRAAISTHEGKMLSFLTGGAKVQVPSTSYRQAFLPQLRREALEGAVRSVHGDLIAYLSKLPPSTGSGAASPGSGSGPGAAPE
jgi:hypothetical protein